jgi:hypothetical protein
MVRLFCLGFGCHTVITVNGATASSSAAGALGASTTLQSQTNSSMWVSSWASPAALHPIVLSLVDKVYALKSCTGTANTTTSGSVGPAAGIVRDRSEATLSPMLHLFHAQYIRYWHSNKYLELRQLNRLAGLHPLPFDVAFFLYQRRRQMRLDAKAAAAGSTMSIEAHVKFGNLKVEADKAVLAARQHQAELWAELAQSKPSLNKLDVLGAGIDAAQRTADRCFQQMIRLNSNSVITLRKYAQYAEEVRGSLLGVHVTPLVAPVCPACCYWLLFSVAAGFAAR